MSNKTTNELWCKAFAEAEKLLSPDAGRLNEDPMKSLNYYIQCVKVYKRLQESYDRLVHPQKRMLGRELLQLVIAELVSAKSHIISKQISFDDLEKYAMAKNLLADDFFIKTSTGLRDDFEKTHSEQMAQVDRSLIKTFVDIRPKQVEISLTIAEAVRIVQIVERGRQARVRFNAMSELKKQQKQQVKQGQAGSAMPQESAAVIIQKSWRGYLGRKSGADEKDKDVKFLNMKMDSTRLNELKIDSKEILETRKKVFHENFIEYQNAVVSEIENIKTVDSILYKEQLFREFREWYIEEKRKRGILPEFPPKEEFMKLDFTFAKCSAGSDAAQDNSKGKKQAPPVNQKKGKGEPAAPVDLPEELKRIQKAYDHEVLRNELLVDMKTRVREEMFTVLSDELSNVKADGKAAKKPKEKAKEAKGSSKKTEANAKLALSELQPLLAELVKSGILVQNDNVEEFDEISRTVYIWKQGLNGWLKDDFEQVLFHFCGIPLVADESVFDGYQKPFSAFVFGDLKTSKFISHLAQKCGAYLFDLSPDTLGKAKSETNEDPAQTIGKVFKAAKSAAPSLIIMRQIDQMFSKKSVPADLDLKTLKKDFSKQLKSLKPSDRVSVIGISYNPIESDAAGLTSSFDISIFKPVPTYGDRQSYLEKSLPLDLKESKEEISSVLASLAPYCDSSQLHDLTDKFKSGKSKYGYSSFEITSKLQSLNVPNNADDQVEAWVKKIASFGTIAEEPVKAPAGKKK